MPRKKAPSTQPRHERDAAADPIAGDVRAWLAALAAGDHVSSEAAQPPLPAKPQAPRTTRRRPRPVGGYVGKSA
jgi:hypothetical protein